MRRTTKADLVKLLAHVTELQGRPSQCWETLESGERVSIPGALQLSHNSVYGGWDLVEIRNASGGEESLIGNTFGGRGRLSAHEMETFLLGMLCALEGTPAWTLTAKGR